MKLKEAIATLKPSEMKMQENSKSKKGTSPKRGVKMKLN